MAESFGVTPTELRGTSGDLDDVSTKMKGVISSLRAQLSAEGAPWGHDHMGEQFADGQNGYLAQVHWVDGSVHAKTSLLDHYAETLKQAADSFESTDGG